MTFTFDQYADIYKRIFRDSEFSFWGDRPIFSRLPSRYNNDRDNRYNDQGEVLVPRSQKLAGPGTLQLTTDKNGLLIIENGLITWEDGETAIKPLVISVGEAIAWEPNTPYTKGELLEKDGKYYSVLYDYTSDVLIEFDLQQGNLILGGISDPGEYYIWFELLKYRPIARLRTDLPPYLSDFISITASREHILHPSFLILEDDPDLYWTPPYSLNNNDSLELTIDGLLEAHRLTLKTTYGVTPSVSLSYKANPLDDYITYIEGVMSVDRVWDIPLPNVPISNLRVNFTGSYSLDVHTLSIDGKHILTGESSLRGNTVKLRATQSLQPTEEALGSCLVGIVVIDDLLRVKKYNDMRSLTFERRETIASWLTQYYDELLVNSKNKIETYIDDQLNPMTAGKNYYKDIFEDSIEILGIDDVLIKKVNPLISPFGG